MSTIRDLRIGLVGAGAFGSHSATGLNAAEGVAVTTVCDLDTARAEQVASNLGATAVKDYAALLDQVDLVYIATLPAARYQLTMEAIEANKHLLCQKPLGSNVGEVREMLDAAEAAGVIHALGHQIRYHPVHRHLRQLIADGYVGETRLVDVHLPADYATTPTMVPYFYCWNTRRAEAGGYVYGLLTHYLDSFRFIFGDLRVAASLPHIAVPMLPRLEDDTPMRQGLPGVAGPLVPAETEDTVVVLAELASGGVMSISGGWALHCPPGNTWSIYGSEGTLVYRDPYGFGSMGELQGARVGEELHVLDTPAEFELPADGGDPLHVAFARDLHAAFNDRSTPTIYPTFADALRNEEIMEAIIEGKAEAVSRPTGI